MDESTELRNGMKVKIIFVFRIKKNHGIFMILYDFKFHKKLMSGNFISFISFFLTASLLISKTVVRN